MNKSIYECFKLGDKKELMFYIRNLIVPQNTSTKILFVPNFFDSADDEISYALEVTSVYPTAGSINGGQRLTIDGEGFSNDTDKTSIMFGDVECWLQEFVSSDKV